MKKKPKPKQNMINIIVITFFFYTFLTAVLSTKYLVYVIILSHLGFAIPDEVDFIFSL